VLPHVGAHKFPQNLRCGPIARAACLKELFAQLALNPDTETSIFRGAECTQRIQQLCSLNVVLARRGGAICGPVQPGSFWVARQVARTIRLVFGKSESLGKYGDRSGIRTQDTD
jgi:hypothetical protein